RKSRNRQNSRTGRSRIEHLTYRKAKRWCVDSGSVEFCRPFGYLWRNSFFGRLPGGTGQGFGRKIRKEYCVNLFDGGKWGQQRARCTKRWGSAHDGDNWATAS